MEIRLFKLQGLEKMMKRLHLNIVWFLLLTFFAMGCRTAATEDELRGRVTLWHSWSPAEAQVLEAVLTQFKEIHPNVRITSVNLPEAELLSEFKKAGNDGLAPGLLIGNAGWIADLADSGLIRPLTPGEIEGAHFNTQDSALVRYKDELFGIPFSLSPKALYYNKTLVEEPPQTLDELLQEAARGNQVAFVPRFQEAHWGVKAFGEGLFDDDGNFAPGESGFEAWLTWLDQAQSAPGIILSTDDESLLDLFASGEIAYYVGGPEKQALIEMKIDEEKSFDLGVAPLPKGPAGEAGTLLPVETLLLYAYASPEQKSAASALAFFLANEQQSVRFMRELGRVPANPGVKVDRRIYPITSGFVQQVRTADVFPNEIPAQVLVEAADRAYVSVLSGSSTPSEAVCRFTSDVAAALGPGAANVRFPEGCAP